MVSEDSSSSLLSSPNKPGLVLGAVESVKPDVTLFLSEIRSCLLGLSLEHHGSLFFQEFPGVFNLSFLGLMRSFVPCTLDTGSASDICSPSPPSFRHVPYSLSTR
mmetsp:Transcript_5158/g.8112  ORF Transcript_5158/g.8112 Transcript_5158/m.8112 type:complete len:105 (+) Transcript_5158:1411-1725(+)